MKKPSHEQQTQFQALTDELVRLTRPGSRLCFDGYVPESKGCFLMTGDHDTPSIRVRAFQNNVCSVEYAYDATKEYLFQITKWTDFPRLAEEILGAIFHLVFEMYKDIPRKRHYEA